MNQHIYSQARVSVECNDPACRGHMLDLRLRVNLSFLPGVVCYEPVVNNDEIYKFDLRLVESKISWHRVEAEIIKNNPTFSLCRLERRPLRGPVFMEE